MTTACWALPFQVLFCSTWFCASLYSAGAPPDLKTYRANPTAAATIQLAGYAALHAKDQNGALANLALGFASYAQKNYGSAVQYLTAARPQLPFLDDYVGYYLALSKVEMTDYGGASVALDSLRGKPSPLASKIILVQANALTVTHRYLEAIEVLRERFTILPQPDADLLLAQAYEGQRELSQAATLYQRVYYTRPATRQAVDAAAAIERLKIQMGKDYPPPIPAQVLRRGDQWMSSKQYGKAKLEFQDMARFLGGVEREQALVRIGAADLLGGSLLSGYRYLKALRLAKSDAEPERLFYLEEGARKTADEPGLRDALQQLEKKYPESSWRLKALAAAANGYFTAGNTAPAMALFRLAADRFPADAAAAQYHWRVAWDAYLRRDSGAMDLMKEQATRYPEDQRASSALYFLGRLSEEGGGFGSARAFYEKLRQTFPHYYYGTLAVDRLAEPNLTAASTDTELAQSLDRIAFPAKLNWKEEAPTPATVLHIERARLLTAAGFPDWAETELRYGAATDGQRPLLALELAKSDPTLAKSLRHMKVLTPEYLTTDLDGIPKEVWGYLFPLPLREDVIRIAKGKNLDPYLVAGLIRQESEFNPVVVSHANAWGWMQLLPSTGRMLARQEGMAAFQPSMLFDPVVNMKLGAAYLRAQLERWNGSLEETLAAYNAGPGRVQQWTAGLQFREPAEFVESIPFTETREYVQSVIRNAAIYRQLYGGKSPPPQPANALVAADVAVKKTAPMAAPAALIKKRPAARRRGGIAAN